MNSYQLNRGTSSNFCGVSRTQWQVTATLHSTDETLSQKPRCQTQHLIAGDWFLIAYLHQVYMGGGIQVRSHGEGASFQDMRRPYMI